MDVSAAADGNVHFSDTEWQGNLFEAFERASEADPTIDQPWPEQAGRGEPSGATWDCSSAFGAQTHNHPRAYGITCCGSRTASTEPLPAARDALLFGVPQSARASGCTRRFRPGMLGVCLTSVARARGEVFRCQGLAGRVTTKRQEVLHLLRRAHVGDCRGTCLFERTPLL